MDHFKISRSAQLHDIVKFQKQYQWDPQKSKTKKIDKQKSYVQLKLVSFCWLTKFVHPITLELEVTGGWYSGLCTLILIGPILVYLTEKKIWDHCYFWPKIVWFQVEWPKTLVLVVFLNIKTGFWVLNVLFCLTQVCIFKS